MSDSGDKKTIMIFSGYNQRAIFAFLRYISPKYEDYVIVANSQDDDILISEYRNKVIYIRKNKQLQLEELLSVIDRVTATEIVIMPTTEALNRFLLDNRDMFLQHRCTIPLVERALYQEISDKSSFYDLCKANGILVPKTRILNTDFEYPYVAKSPKYYNKNGETISPILVMNEEEHKAFLNRKDHEEFDIQEFIEGESYYLLYYFDKRGNVRKFSQKNLLQQPGGKSILAAISANLHKEEISLAYEHLFEKKNFYGLVMVEVRKRNETYYMIEANPRFWGPSQLFVDAGVDFFGLLLHDCGIEVGMGCDERQSLYYWGGGRSASEVWLESGRAIFEKQKDLFISADIYNREDSLEIFESERKHGQE
jgi:carbamoylphosphate synthase large subunit